MHAIASSSLALAAATLLLSCQRESNEQPGSNSAPELSAAQREQLTIRGNEAAAALLKNLSTQLKAALTSGKPAEAVRVCQQVALPITESTAQQFEGASIRRTSLRIRNSKNAPDAGDRALLTRWQDLHDRHEALPPHELHPTADGARFYRPIMVNAVCLKCHGDSESLDQDFRELLDHLYPGDQARGYKVGDLRGVVRIDLRTDPP